MKSYILLLLLLIPNILNAEGFGPVGDNLGSHDATQRLNMGNNSITASNRALEIDTNTVITGNLGIGTTSPGDQRLDVIGTSPSETSNSCELVEFRDNRVTEGSDPNYVFAINRQDSYTAALYLGNDGDDKSIIATNNKCLRIGKDNAGNFTEYMRLETDGNLGIGTTDPQAIIDVTPDVVGINTYSRPAPLVTNTQKNAMSAMPNGAMIVNSDSNVLDVYNGSYWKAQSPENTVYVNDASDLPPNNILVAGKTYDFAGNVIVSSMPLTMAATGESNFGNGFFVCTATTTGVYLRATTINTRLIYHMAFQCPNGASLFDVSASGSGIGAAFILDNVGAASFDGVNPGAGSIGIVEYVTPVFLENAYYSVDGGLEISNAPLGGAINNLRIDFSSTTVGTLLSFNGASMGNFTVDTYQPNLDPGQYALDFDTNTTFSGINYYGGLRVYQNGATKDQMFAPGSYDQTSLGFKFALNTDIPDSTADIKLSMTDNLTVTTFTAVNVPTLVSGAWIPGSERFIGTAKGRATYIGLEDIKINVFANPTAVTGIGTNKDVSFYFVYGNEIDNFITSFADAGGGQVTATSTGHGLSIGDRVVIKNTSNYNGTYVVTNTTTDTFEFTDTFVATDTGDWAIIIEDSIAQNQLGSTTKASNTAVATLLTMITNDYIELFIENNTDGQSLIVKNSNLILSK